MSEMTKTYSPAELMAKWGYSRATVIRLIRDEPGVLKLRLGPKGARTTYSVPEEVERRIRNRLSDPPRKAG